ncbi:MAG: hypothetical protein U1E55_13040 [Paracoccus sp. (in: a-proteobacteria)]
MKSLKFALAGLLLSAMPAMAEELIMSSWLPPKHPIVVNAFKPWAEAVEKATDGRVTVRIMGKPWAARRRIRHGPRRRGRHHLWPAFLYRG